MIKRKHYVKDFKDFRVRIYVFPSNFYGSKIDFEFLPRTKNSEERVKNFNLLPKIDDLMKKGGFISKNVYTAGQWVCLIFKSPHAVQSMMSNGLPPFITDEDIERLFGENVNAGTVKIENPTWKNPDFEMVNPLDYYWRQRGQCPNCKDSVNIPKSMPGGYFECQKCKWTNLSLKK